MPKRRPICRKLVDERHRTCAECGYDWMLEPRDWWNTPAGLKFAKSRRSRMVPMVVVGLIALLWFFATFGCSMWYGAWMW